MGNIALWPKKKSSSISKCAFYEGVKSRAIEVNLTIFLKKYDYNFGGILKVSDKRTKVRMMSYVLVGLTGLIFFNKNVLSSQTYTLDSDFDSGNTVNLNHDPNHDQLQLNKVATPFPFVNIAASSRGTMVRIDVNTGAILGEYRTVKWTPQSRQ